MDGQESHSTFDSPDQYQQPPTSSRPYTKLREGHGQEKANLVWFTRHNHPYSIAIPFNTKTHSISDVVEAAVKSFPSAKRIDFLTNRDAVLLCFDTPEEKTASLSTPLNCLPSSLSIFPTMFTTGTVITTISLAPTSVLHLYHLWLLQFVTCRGASGFRDQLQSLCFQVANNLVQDRLGNGLWGLEDRGGDLTRSTWVLVTIKSRTTAMHGSSSTDQQGFSHSSILSMISYQIAVAVSVAEG
ncbi:MAG: hypothetical protein JOS17DRAFT_787870 [Linnemannia elongata]|nr:MAG: hypothetical protein JOS17DRAFT_787870 [Linnemannia elongata]